MAGDWIKVRTALPKDGRIRIAAKKLQKTNAIGNASTNAYCVTVFGALVTLWSFADGQSDESGVLVGYDFSDINDMVGIDGFCEALPSDWITESDGWVKLTDYQQHNGKNAKVRAQTAKRVANAKANAKTVSKVTQEPLPDALPREEKRREEVKEGAYALNADAWNGWIEYRKKRKLAAYTTDKVKNKLCQLSPSKQSECVNDSIAQNYNGIFPDKFKDKPKPLKTQSDNELMAMAQSLNIQSQGKSRFDLIAAIEAKQ